LVSQCANPECSEPFVYLRTGKLFAVPRREVAGSSSSVEYFWLCGRCSETMQPEFSNHEPHCTFVMRRVRETRWGS
jgi:hypothetical protein